jgi:predicted ATPase
MRRYVLTGAPGCGKTTVAAALGQRGYVVVTEAATDVIAKQQARGVDEPWEREDFLDQVVELQRQRQLEAGDNGTVRIFDRSPLCSLALARYFQRPVSLILNDEIARVVKDKIFEQDVFLLRPLGFVTATAARRISYADSLEFERIHEATYREHGFRLVDIAPGDVLDEQFVVVSAVVAGGGQASLVAGEQ